MVKKMKHFANLQQRNTYVVYARKRGDTAQEVSEAVGITEKQVRNVFITYRQNGRVSRKKGSGRPEVLNKHYKLLVLRVVSFYPLKPLVNIIDEYNVPYTIRTVENYLEKAGFTNKRTSQKPYLSYQNEQVCLF